MDRENPYQSPREWEPAVSGELPEYDAELVERVRRLVAEKTDTRLRKVSLETSLAFDIGINGDDVTNLFEAFTREFNVDPRSLPSFDFGGLFLSEYEILQKKYFDNGLISRWYVTNNLEADTNTATTGQILLMKVGRSTMKRSVIYPYQRKPLLDKRTEGDIKYMILEADIFKIYNTNAVTKSSADVTSSSAGIVQNGLFMAGSSVMQRPPRPTNIGVS